MEKKIILDSDLGIDDSIALGTLLGGGADLIGITTTFGNVTPEQSAENIASLLSLSGHEDLPIHVGNSIRFNGTPYQRLKVTNDIHGINGFANIKLPVSGKQYPHDAADWLISMIHQYQKDLDLMFIGSLNNLACALEKEPNIADGMGTLYIMGGCINVPGNVTQYGEANIMDDVEGAALVFQKVHDIRVLGLDVTTATFLTRDAVKKWGKYELGSYYETAENFYIDAEEKLDHLRNCAYVHDPSTAAAYFHPEYFEWRKGKYSVDVGTDSRGKIVQTADSGNQAFAVNVNSMDVLRFIDQAMIQYFEEAASEKVLK